MNKRKTMMIIFLGLFLLTMTISNVQGQTTKFSMNSNSRTVIKVPLDYPTIQEAIDAAESGDTVLVSPGKYVENIDFLQKSITVKSSDGAEFTIIDGKDPVDPDHGSVVTFDDSWNAQSVLDGFTLTNGSGNLVDTVYCGGGLYIYHSSPTIINNIIVDNSVDYGGGGISCDYFSSPKIINNSITENYADYHGGGIFCYDSSSPTIENNVIQDNRAGYYGNSRIRSSRFDISDIYTGAGIHSYSSSSLINNNIIKGNSAPHHGGGILTANQPPSTISNNIIYENIGEKGAGIYCCHDSNPFIDGNEIFQNTATNLGGGICLRDDSAVLTNNVIYENTAVNVGGGIYNTQSPSTIVGNTVYKNSADLGGGFYCSHLSATVTNNIFWDNSANVDPEISENLISANVSFCDVKGGWPGKGNIDADPLFKDPDNGDFHLIKGSPCVDVGDNLASLIPDFDFDGDLRVIDGDGDGISTVDIGADEFVTFSADSYKISASSGGTINFVLDANIVNANRNYVILGSLTGFEPGYPLPGGLVNLPLNWDVFTDIVLKNLNTVVFSDFLGKLDSGGQASAQLNVPSIDNGLVGTKIYFAYACNNPFDFVSNPVAIEIVE